jgi:opacity protein-like surface antigen
MPNRFELHSLPFSLEEIMMSLRKILAGAFVAGLLQLALMGPAAADLTKGPYLGVAGGVAWTGNLTYTTDSGGCFPPYYCNYPNYYNALTYDVGYSAGAQVGYATGNGPRVELEYNYRNNSASTIATTTGTQGATGDLSSTAYMINVLYDFETGSKWVPYVGFGLGMADVQANDIHSSATNQTGSYLSGGGNEFAAQFIFGAEYQVSDKMGITIDWRGLWASNTTFNYGIGCAAGGTGSCVAGQTGVIDYDYWNGAANLGIRIKF